jgi:site-specific DNA-cytosine methylase
LVAARELRYAAKFISAASLALLPEALSLTFGPACEIDGTCIPILKSRMTDGECIHKDILQRCSWAVRAHAMAKRSMSDVDVYAAWASMQKAGCSEAAGSCHIHKCNCPTPSTTADISGSHCTLWSQMGPRRKTKSHQIFFLLSWCLWVMWTKPVFLIHENVPGFDENLMRFLLGDVYVMLVLPAEPSQVGWSFVSRRRKYFVLWMSARVEATCCMESMHPGLNV